MDQMLERLAGNQYYCFLDGFSGYFQIPIDPKDQEKTAFTCPYGTFAYRRIPFGLCNAPGTFQRCMMAIFYDMIEKTMEVFMDDFSVFRNSFQSCLSHLDQMLKRCEDTNLCLNWEKSHFMVKEDVQAPAYQALAHQTQGVSKEDFSAYVKANDTVMRNIQTQGQNMQNQLTNLTDLMTKFVNANTASTSNSGTLPSNTIANPRSDLKAITTRSGVSYDGPQIPPPPSFLPSVVENKPEATKDIVNPTNNENTEDIQPQAVHPKPVTYPISEPTITPVSASRPNPQASIPYPSRSNDERNRERAKDQIEKFYQIFKDMSFEISFADALMLMPKFASTLKALIENKEKLSEMARTPLNEHCSAVLLKKLPEKLGDPGKFLIHVISQKRLSLFDLTPTCMTLELADRSITSPVVIAEDVYVKTGKSLIDVFKDELTLRVGKEAITFNLDQTSRYSANYNDMTAKRIDVIDVACEEYSKEVLDFSDTISSGNPTPFYDP
nr:reverse transcriptase domain-containing protein [Tanacetum cinerariifolium]